MKSLLWFCLFSVAAQADVHRAVSGPHGARINNLLKEMIGIEGFSGHTDQGVPCRVTYRSHDVLFNGLPSGDKFNELLVTSQGNTCGASGSRFMIDKSDISGGGSLYDLTRVEDSVGRKVTWSVLQSYNVNGAELRGETLRGTTLTFIIERSKISRVELTNGRACSCRIDE